MSAQPITLIHHLLTREKTAMPLEDFVLVMERIVIAAKRIANELSHAPIGGGLGYSGGTNIHGEEQKKLDEWTNQVFVEVFHRGYPVCSLISEEMDEPMHYERNCRGRSYAVIYDPLDGSSNSEVNGPVGSIFSVRQRAQQHGHEADDLLVPGTSQLAAGYVLYGAATELVYTAGNGVDVFTYDRAIGEFVLTRENIKMPSRGKAYAVNQGNIGKWHPGARKLVEHMTSRRDKSTSYSLRYTGCLVADFHRCLLEGGMYLYPGEALQGGKSTSKIRLMYELAPLAMVAEEAGGRASNGSMRILDIVPGEIHERQPIYIGSSQEVALAEEFKPED